METTTVVSCRPLSFPDKNRRCAFRKIFHSKNWLGPQLWLVVSLALVGVDGVTEPLLVKRANK